MSKRRQLFVHYWCFSRIQNFSVSIFLVLLVLVRSFLCEIVLWGFSMVVQREMSQTMLLNLHWNGILTEIQRNVRPFSCDLSMVWQNLLQLLLLLLFSLLLVTLAPSFLRVDLDNLEFKAQSVGGEFSIRSGKRTRNQSGTIQRPTAPATPKHSALVSSLLCSNRFQLMTASRAC